jgi:hypothetical protein
MGTVGNHDEANYKKAEALMIFWTQTGKTHGKFKEQRNKFGYGL